MSGEQAPEHNEKSAPEGHEPPQEPADDAPPPPANRAERRARGKGSGGQSAMPQGKGRVSGNRGGAPGPRNWANRRSG